jgi:polyene glycosyltransferase
VKSLQAFKFALGIYRFALPYLDNCSEGNTSEGTMMNNATRPVLFVSLPGAGTFHPLFVLAEELARRGGANLWFATDEPRRSEIEATPMRFASLGEVVPELSAVSWDDQVYREVTQRSRFGAHRAVIRHTYRPDLSLVKYRQLEAIVDKVRPALMVIDCETRYAISLAVARGIPYVLSVPRVASNVLTPFTPFGRSYVPRGFPTPHTGLPYQMSLAQQIANQWFRVRALAMFFSPGMSKVLRQDIAINKELGLPQPESMTRVAEAELVLCYSVAEIDYPVEVPANLRRVGAMIPPLPQAPAGELAGWLDARPSVVYIGLGTITKLTRAEIGSLVEVARRLDGAHHVLWKLPQAQQHLLPPRDSLPGNLRIEDWMPSQLDVLAHPHVTAFVTHGGGNGFEEGLYFGKPLVIRPLWTDCFDNAVRGQDKGVGLTLVLTEPSFSRRAQELAACQQAAGGARAAADLLLSLPALA